MRAGGPIKAEVDRLAQPLIDRGELCGAVVGVVTPEGTQTFGYGRTGRPNDPAPPAGDSIFQVGSVSKLFVASLLSLLVQEGVLSYDETVRRILPPEVEVSEDVGELTLYELVTNTGGLPRQPVKIVQSRYFARYLVTGKNLYAYIDRKYLYEYLRTLRLKPKSERKYAYSNLGAALLADLIEIKTGRPFTELVEEKICRPLKLRDTGYALDSEQRTRLVTGHAGDQPKFMLRNAPIADWDMGEFMRPSGGLYSTAEDLMTFARSNLGLLGSPLDSRLAETHRVQIRTPGEDVALGWIINHFDQDQPPSTPETDASGTHLTYKHGMIAGYTAYIGMDLDRKLAVVVLCNNFNWQDKIGHNLLLRLARANDTSGIASEGSP